MAPPQAEIAAGILTVKHVRRQVLEFWQAGPGNIGEGVMLIVVAGIEQQPVGEPIVGIGWIDLVVTFMFAQRLAQVGDAEFSQEQGERPVVVKPAPETKEPEHDFEAEYHVAEIGQLRLKNDSRAAYQMTKDMKPELKSRVWVLLGHKEKEFIKQSIEVHKEVTNVQV